MKLVEIKWGAVRDKGMSENAKYTFKHYLDEEIKTAFNRMSFDDVYNILVKRKEYPSFFVGEVVTNAINMCISYRQEDRENVEYSLESEYYDYCIDSLKKLATAKYGNKFSTTMKGYKTAVYGRKGHRDGVMQLKHSVRKMF